MKQTDAFLFKKIIKYCYTVSLKSIILIALAFDTVAAG